METKVLPIVGMSCGHCQKAVAEALQALAGVTAVTVDLEKATATVSYDAKSVSETNLKEAIAEAGYEIGN